MKTTNWFGEKWLGPLENRVRVAWKTLVWLVAFTMFLQASSIIQQAYNLVQNNGTPLARRTTLNCTNGLTCVDSGGITVMSVPTANGTFVTTGPTNNSAMTFAEQGQVNTCNPAADYQDGQGGTGVNFAVIGNAGCANANSMSTNKGAIGMQGSARNASTTTDGVAGYFPAFASGAGSGTADANRVRIWGLNSLLGDLAHMNVLMTNELDFNVTASGTKVLGLQFTGASTQPLSSDSVGMIIGPPGSGVTWPLAISCADAAAAYCLQLGKQAAGNNVYSQVQRFISTTSGGMNNTTDLYEAPTGGFNINQSTADPVLVAMNGTVEWRINADGSIQSNGVAFASLGAPSNGTIQYCTNCQITASCTSGGSGAIAKRLNGAWICN